MPKTVLLWDIDGTLLLTGGAGKIAFNQVFEDLFEEKEVWGGIVPDGRTDHSLIEEMFLGRFGRYPTHDEKTRVTDRYHEVMPAALIACENYRLMPKVRETLDFLSKASDKYSLGIATGNFKIAAWQKLERGGLGSFFQYGGYGSDSPDRSELTRLALERAIRHIGGTPTEVYVIGDTVHDMRCGKMIGAKTIGVCTGSTDREILMAEEPTVVIEDLSEFFSIIS